MAGDWKRRSAGVYTQIDWDRWLCADHPLDPYLVWADLCGEYGFARSSGPFNGSLGKWSLLVEAVKEGLSLPASQGQACAKDVCVAFGMLDIPDAYKTGSAAGPLKLPGRFFTAQVSPNCLEHLLCAPEIKGFQLGLPRIIPPLVPNGFFNPARDKASGDEVGRMVVGVIDDGCAFAHPRFQGCDGPRVKFIWDQDSKRHTDRDYWHGTTGFSYGAQLDAPAIAKAVATGLADDVEPYRVTRYGRFRLDPDAASSQPQDADRPTPRSLPQATQLTASHGTSVLHLAAGYPSPLREQRVPPSTAAVPRPALDDDTQIAIDQRLKQIGTLPPGDQPGIDAAAQLVDAADQFPVVFVQLPSSTVADTSGGSLAVHVLDGVRYIRQRALEIPYENPDPTKRDNGRARISNRVVVNISWGALAGSHDGESMIERALVEQVETVDDDVAPVTFVVTAAGNAHRAGNHADVMLGPGGCETLFWTLGPDNPLESYLEVWLPDTDVLGKPIGEALAASLLVQVMTPDLQPSRPVCLGQAQLLEVPEDRPLLPDRKPAPLAGAIFCRKVVQGVHGTMLLVAVGPTRQPPGDPRPAAPHGEWRVELDWRANASGTAPVQVHAWTERSDLVFGGARPQQSRLAVRTGRFESSENDPEVVRDWSGGWAYGGLRMPAGLRSTHTQATMSGPLSGHAMPSNRVHSNITGRVVSVGAYRLSDGEMSVYSSGGPVRGLPMSALWSGLLGVPDRLAHGLRPETDAPGDFSLANPGLRTAGTWPATQVRVSGTSAAAASMTRLIANTQYWALRGNAVGRAVEEWISGNLLAPHQTPRWTAGAGGDGRPTLNPQADDALRRGASRVR